MINADDTWDMFFAIWASNSCHFTLPAVMPMMQHTAEAANITIWLGPLSESPPKARMVNTSIAISSNNGSRAIHIGNFIRSLLLFFILLYGIKGNRQYIFCFHTSIWIYSVVCQSEFTRWGVTFYIIRCKSTEFRRNHQTNCHFFT